MRRRFLTGLTILVLLLAGSVANAQVTSSGTLTVTATVAGSISLVFNSDASGVALTGSGTNTATLAFGNVSAFGAVGGGITRTATASDFTVSSPVDVFVSKTNTGSANYTLTAQLNAADATNTWKVGGVTVTNAAASTITATGAYTTNVAETVALTIPFSTASGTGISNSLAFVATAN